MKWIYVTDEGGVPLREGRRVSFEGQEAALFHTLHGWFAVENRCPHKAGPLADGILSHTSVFCPLHNWKVGLETGRVQDGGVGCVKRFPVKVEAGKVYISPEE
jgi:nitrite reductase (NADH) small subunit